MKELISILFLYFYMVICCAQTTYNKRIDLGFPSMVITNIERQDSTCYMIGVSINPENLSLLGTIFIKMDLKGNILDSNYHSLPGQLLTAWEPNMRFISDTVFQFVGSIQTDIPFRPWLVTLDTLGNIMSSVILIDYAGTPENYAIGKNWALDDDSNLMIFYDFVAPNGLPVAIDKYIGEQFIDRRQITFGDGNWHESLLSIEDRWILGVRHLKNVADPNPKNRIYQCGLYSIDKNMHIIQEWISPPDSAYFAAYDILRVDDNEYVIATLKREPLPIFGDHFQPYLIRVNTSSNQVLWNIDLSLDTTAPENASRKLLFNQDTTAIYIAGQQFEIGILNVRPPQVHGFLAKVTMEGELQWIRRYLGTEGSKFPDHKIFDAELLPDGSIIMVGESTDLFVDEPPGQRGWILRVDSFGCLVPGCHLVNIDQPVPQESLDIRVYPNPVVHDQVWVYVADDRLTGRLRFTLHDLQGRTIHQWQQEHYHHSTYLLDIPPGLTSGTYILRLEDSQGHTWQEKLIIAP